MMSLRRRGFTLVEVMASMTLGAIVLTGLYQLYLSHQRLTAWQLEAVTAHDAYRVASSLLSRDLREAVPTDGDLLLPAHDSVVVRAPVGLAWVCASRSNPPVLGLTRASGSLPGSVGDSLLVFVGESWETARVRSIDTPGQRGMECAYGASTPELQVRLDDWVGDDLVVGAPVRVFRRHRYHTTRLGSELWLARTTPDGTEPLVGPIAALDFRLSASDGAETLHLEEAAGVAFTMVLETTPVRDTLRTLFQLRGP